MRIPKTLGSNDWYTWRDFNIGCSMNFNQHIIRVVNCDLFTRKFLTENGISLNDPEGMPEDHFDNFVQLKNMKIPPPDIKEYKEYFEVKLGGGNPNGGLAQYINNDRKVLNFNVMWTDKSLEGDVNYFTLEYFLSDGTCDVKEVRALNNGKDVFPLYLTRMKLPKVPILTHYPGMSLKKEEFYTP